MPSIIIDFPTVKAKTIPRAEMEGWRDTARRCGFRQQRPNEADLDYTRALGAFVEQVIKTAGRRGK